MYERLIKWLYYRTREGRQIARNNEQRQDKYMQLVNSALPKRNPEVQRFCEYLMQGGYVPAGVWYTENSAVRTLVNQARMVLVQLHRDGTLNRVFVEVNDNNLERVASKLLGENDHVQHAIDRLNEALEIIHVTHTESEYDEISRRVRMAVNLLRVAEKIA